MSVAVTKAILLHVSCLIKLDVKVLGSMDEGAG